MNDQKEKPINIKDRILKDIRSGGRGHAAATGKNV